MKKTFLLLTVFCLFRCSGGDDEEILQITPLGKIDNVSLDYQASSQMVSLTRDIESEGATLALKDNAFGISHLTLSENIITFDVLENIYTEPGCRFDTIEIKIAGERIGTICVSQARTFKPEGRLKWSTENASYYINKLDDSEGGLEATKFIYNLEKTTNGADSYKNYPAFAYCIEMNHDPENNIEWYLPSDSEMYAKEDDLYSDFSKHNYWWSTNNGSNGYAFPFSVIHGTTKVSKLSSYYIYAFSKK